MFAFSRSFLNLQRSNSLKFSSALAANVVNAQSAPVNASSSTTQLHFPKQYSNAPILNTTSRSDSNGSRGSTWYKNALPSLLAFGIGCSLLSNTQIAQAEEKEDVKQNTFTPPKSPFIIALTGGPCSGKTTALTTLSQKFKRLGFNVYLVPEAATLLINGGVDLSILADPAKNVSWQIALMSTQMSLEDAFTEASKTKPDQPTIILCDRGVLDSAAYCSDEQFEFIMDTAGWKKVELRDQRYDAVFHLVTAAVGAEKFYTTANNTARSETLEQARALDYQTLQSWLGHRALYVFDNSTDFKGKISRIVNTLVKLVGLPRVKAHERKLLLDQDWKYFKSLEWPVAFSDVNVETCFLTVDDPNQEIRLYKRGQGGSYTYTYSEKQIVDHPDNEDGQQYAVVERHINGREYAALKRQIDPDRKIVKKTMRCFVWNNRYYQLNYYKEPVQVCVLEVEDSDATTVDDLLPTFFNCQAKDVTNSTYESNTFSK